MQKSVLSASIIHAATPVPPPRRCMRGWINRTGGLRLPTIVLDDFTDSLTPLKEPRSHGADGARHDEVMSIVTTVYDV